MATRPADLRMSLAAFLDWDDGTDTRYELIDGRVVAMAPPNPRHSAMTGRLARLIGNALKPPCEVFVAAGIVTPARADTYLQADLAVRAVRSTSMAATSPSRFSSSRWHRRARRGTTVKSSSAVIRSWPRCRRSCWSPARSAGSSSGAARAAAGAPRT